MFSKGDIVDLTVLKESLLTDRYETMIRVERNSKRLKREIDVGKYSFSQGPYLERVERITDQSNWKKGSTKASRILGRMNKQENRENQRKVEL